MQKQAMKNKSRSRAVRQFFVFYYLLFFLFQKKKREEKIKVAVPFVLVYKFAPVRFQPVGRDNRVTGLHVHKLDGVDDARTWDGGEGERLVDGADLGAADVGHY
jgi:hypothetical protein